MTPRVKTVETMRVHVRVTQADIDGGKCGMISKCMIKIANEREIRRLDPQGGDHHTRVDAGAIRFNYKGNRYQSHLPRIAKRNLIQFDREKKARARAARKGEKFASKVRPFNFVIEAIKYRKVEAITAERQKQVNEARRVRKAQGRPDRQYNMKGRIEGLSLM